MIEQWIVVQPGGPSGPFYSVISSTGRVIALQIPDDKVAGRISRMPENDAQDQRLVNDLRNIRNAILLDELDQQLAISSLNFWISVYNGEHDG